MGKDKKSIAKKFGTFQGVFVPSTEAILGTVLFLLLPGLTADVGLIPIAIIIILAHTVTIATAFSLSDCATNLNTIGGGGMYALSRRSLGKAFGGSIGIMLYFAQASSIAFYCIGFAEPLQQFIAPFFDKIGIFSTAHLNSLFEAGQITPEIYEETLKLFILRHKQVIALIIFILFFITAMVGADFTLKIQLFILVILFGSVAAIFLSPFLGLKLNGSFLFYEKLSSINLWGSRQWGKSLPVIIAIFFMTFTQFFPAVTGIDAGVGMSGDLKNPKRSLVRGTFFAISVTFSVYILSAVIFALMKKELILPDGISKAQNLTILLGLTKNFPKNIPGIMVLLGILFATSSSALSCFMTAPRTMQSLAKDRVLPNFLNFLGNDFNKKGDEPRFATLVTFFIALIVIIIGEITIAAMIVGICFLVVYGWMNGSAFFERISKNPTFRPTIKNHWLVSFYGLLAALVAICLFDWRIGVLMIALQLLIFWLILRFKSENKLEGVWWGVLFSFVLKSLASLKKIIQGTKNWRPIVSVISFAESQNSVFNLAHLGERIASIQGLVYMNILVSPKNKVILDNEYDYPIPVKKINLISNDITQSALSILLSSHPGGIDSNSVLMAYKKSINTMNLVSRCIEAGKNVLLLKNGSKLTNFSKIDIWWRGQKNGNLMVLLAYIINYFNNNELKKKKKINIRIIRKLDKNDDGNTAYDELKELLDKGRITGEVIILPNDEKSISESINDFSKESDLVMVGMPGKINSEGISKALKLNEMFFDKELQKYDNMPAMLFVKSAYLMNLIEDSTM